MAATRIRQIVKSNTGWNIGEWIAVTFIVDKGN